jgi:hypothetical protein
MGQAIEREQSATELRQRAARYRRLASLYGQDVAAVMIDVADEVALRAEALEDGDTVPNQLLPLAAQHAVAG